MKGIVYKSTGSWYRVKSEGIFYRCRIKGKFRTQGIKSTNPVTVGDVVVFFLETNRAEQTYGIITSVCERKNHIVRKSVNLSKQTHIIAASKYYLYKSSLSGGLKSSQGYFCSKSGGIRSSVLIS